METRSLKQALAGRTDCPPPFDAQRWITRGWVYAEGGGTKGRAFKIDDEALWQIRALNILRPYVNTKIMKQVGQILQNRKGDDTYTGWIGVLDNGVVCNVAPNTKPTVGPIAERKGTSVSMVFTVTKMPPEEQGRGA